MDDESGLGIKLVSGKLKLKFGFNEIRGLAVMIGFVLFFVVLLGYGIWTRNSNLIIASIAGIPAMGLPLSVCPYMQNANHYYIIFAREDSLGGFQLYYKGKLVNVLYNIGYDGRISFVNNKKKISCISYIDGTKMRRLEKSKIINYFVKWLSDNHLLSDGVSANWE